MTQALGARVRAGEAGRVHDLSYTAPCRRSAPRPQLDALTAAAAFLNFPEAVNEVQGINDIVRNRNGPVQALAAFLEAFEDDDITGKIHAVGRQRQAFADPASGKGEHHAKSPNRSIAAFGGFKKGTALVAG